MVLRYWPFLFLFLLACKSEDLAEKLIKDSVEAYGMDQLDGRRISFDFRDKSYLVERNQGQFLYQRSFLKDSIRYKDILVNASEFTRLENGDTAFVPEESQSKYSNSVNSVLYFFQLPYVLLDDAARRSFIGEQKVFNENYQLVQVTFGEDNGGSDHEDVFVYWINKRTFLIDYFAYNYKTDGGGVRFRQATQRQLIDGITFQNYDNYQAEIGTPLEELSALFERGELKLLSKIQNQNIKISRIDEGF